MYDIIISQNGGLRFEPLPQSGASSHLKELKHHLGKLPEEALFYLGTVKEKTLPPALNYWSKFSKLFIETARLNPSIEELREKVEIPPNKVEIQKLLQEAPFMAGSEYLDESYLLTQWAKLNQYFTSEIKLFKGSIEKYFSELNSNLHLAGRVFFHLVENKEDHSYPFAFMATYLADAKEKENPIHRPLRYALEEYKEDRKKMLLLLATIRRVADFSKFINSLLESKEIFEPLKWTPKEAQIFLEETHLYIQSGILCRIPSWWKSKSQGARLNFNIGEKKNALFGTKSLLNFNVRLRLGEYSLTEEEIQKLLKESDGLAFLKGKWVKVDKKKLSEVLKKWKQAKELVKKMDLSFHEAMRLLSGEKSSLGNLELDDYEVTSGEWLDSLFKKLRNPKLARNITLSRKFRGALRRYQKEGFNWLNFLSSIGLGGCLADDMGLGKTVQILAFIQNQLETRKKRFFLIVPTSLLSNWASEIQKFTPDLNYLIAHPSNSGFTELKTITQRKLTPYDLVITTYGLIRRFEWPQKIKWDYLILDEAQAIKNPLAVQTRAIKAIQSRNRFTLTGTPIENQLGDLWSIFDFMNPGLLGSKTEFANFNKKLTKKNKGFSSLRQMIHPYILRRLKTDKTIISDLPEKIELKSYTTLSKKQAVHYSKLVYEISTALKGSKGIQRRGLILASLVKFKQICNHPDQYLGTGNFKAKDSGKFERIRDICEIIFEKREKVLIFTQFKEIIRPLDKFLQELSGHKGVFLHGATLVKKRNEVVKKFQSNEYTPYFVLSLKAGGIGLNLTEANHVIHFDRWWNPAVENQATDRVFRIGQEKKVIVHKLITKGTLEEKIDKLLESKSELFENVIGKTSEKWVTEMTNEELLNLIRLENVFS